MPFIDLLDNLSLQIFMNYKGFWSPEIIRAFYTTLEYRIRERKLYAEIRGKRVELTELRLAEIFGIPPPGPEDFCFMDQHNSLSPSFYGKAEVYKTINREEEFTGQEIRVSSMDASDRLLLNVISHIVFHAKTTH